MVLPAVSCSYVSAGAKYLIACEKLIRYSTGTYARKLLIVMSVIQDEPLEHLQTPLDSRPCEARQAATIGIPQVVLLLQPVEQSDVVICAPSALLFI